MTQPSEPAEPPASPNSKRDRIIAVVKWGLKALFSWESAKAILSLAAVVVAGAALWQSHETARIQSQQADEALKMQQKTLDRQNAMVSFRNIDIELDTPTLNKYLSFPIDKTSNITSTEVIPADEWASATSRYVIFTIQNQGESSFYVDKVGLGTSYYGLAWADPSYRWCETKDGRDNFVSDCSREIPAATETRYSLALNSNVLGEMDDGWAAEGLQVCAWIEAYNTSCDRSWAAPPKGFKNALMTPPG